MSRGRSIAGRKKQQPTDLYETPPEATQALLEVEPIEGMVWEPCAGYGRMAAVLEAHGLDVFSSDIIEDAYGIGGVDYFATDEVVDNVITNPPYRDAQAIIEHALPRVRCKACFLLKLTFLESAKRKPFFEATPPSRVWVFSSRITMWPHGEDEPVNGGTIAYAWFVWDVTDEGPPTLGWL